MTLKLTYVAVSLYHEVRPQFTIINKSIIIFYIFQMRLTNKLEKSSEDKSRYWTTTSPDTQSKFPELACTNSLLNLHFPLN